MTNVLSKTWMSLATITLLVSGVLALIVTGAKMPGIKSLVGNIEIIRWCLVVHVNLATLVWFTAVPMGLINLSARTNKFSTYLAYAGLMTSVVGILLMTSISPWQGTEIILANYIPVLAHPRYYLGIGLYLLGVLMNILAPRTEDLSESKKFLGLKECRFGFLIGSIFLIMAAGTMAKAFMDLDKLHLISNFRIFEVGMWGGGHLIQHACAVFLVCSWVILLSHYSGRVLFSRSELFPIFAWLGIPIFVVPLLLQYEVTSHPYREGFTQLMRWGIAPPIFYLLFLTARRFPFSWGQLKDHRVAAMILSGWLLILGFVFGAFIRGPDMRVPGHYHAGIGAVTLAFMVVAFTVLSKSASRWILPSVWAYGIGQTLFAGGMFVAGSFGMPRKTYGSEQVLVHWGQSLGIGIMACGGVIAIAGGLFFALAIFPQLTFQNLGIKTYVQKTKARLAN